MEIKIGDILEEITLPTINGSNFSLSSLKGKKVLLTFYRFARCPMCNLRINEILKRYDELGKNFTMVGIFDSKINNLKQAMSRHDIPFAILADENFKYFEKYEVKTSWWGVIRASSNKPSLVIVTESPTSDSRKKKIFEFIDNLLKETGKVGKYDQKI